MGTAESGRGPQPSTNFDHNAQALGEYSESAPTQSPLYGIGGLLVDTTSIAGPYVGRGPRGYTRSDDRTLEDVCEKLTEHGQIDASDIEVTIAESEITLSGTVTTVSMKRLAEDAAYSVLWVREVHNRLQATASAAATQ